MIDWGSVALGPQHDLNEFNCGVPALNDWLRDHAAHAAKRGTAQTYVFVPLGNNRVVAYYSLTPFSVSRTGLTTALTGGLGSRIPGFLLGKLALDRTLHGRRLGAQLLRDAMRRVVEAADVVSGRLLVVDAIDERAAAFYRKYHFTPIPGDSLRLVVKIATIRKFLGR